MNKKQIAELRIALGYAETIREKAKPYGEGKICPILHNIYWVKRHIRNALKEEIRKRFSNYSSLTMKDAKTVAELKKVIALPEQEWIEMMVELGLVYRELEG